MESPTFVRPDLEHVKLESVAVGERQKPEGRPMPREVGSLEGFEQYLKRANAIGYQPSASHVVYERLKIVVAENNILVYDAKAVDDWLHLSVKKEKKRGLTMVWKPLRGALDPNTTRSLRDVRYQFEKRNSSSTWGRIDWYRRYEKIIPEAVLSTAEVISRNFKEEDPLYFFVSDYEVVLPDPFLAVAIPGFPFVIVDFWDEPGFKPKAAALT